MATAQRVYVIHSGVRKRHTRGLRMARAAGTRPKFVQKLGGGDIVVRRSRPVAVAESVLNTHLEEIKIKQSMGLVEVRTMSGELVDLNTMKTAAPKVAPPKPKPSDKSVAADKPGPAEPKRMYPEGRGITESVDAPAVTQDALPDGKDLIVEPEVRSVPKASKRKKSKR